MSETKTSLVESLSTEEKVICVCSAAVAVLCFLPWWSVSLGGAPSMIGQASFGASVNAFKFTEGVLAFICALAAAGSVPAAKAGLLQLQPRVMLLAPLAACGAALVCMLIFLGGGGASGFSAPQVSAGKTLWFYVSLVLMAVATFHAFKRFQHGSEEGGSAADGDAP